MSTKKPVSTEVETIKTEELKTEQLDPVDVMNYREYYAGKAEKADEKAEDKVVSEADVASVAETASEAETTSEPAEETENKSGV